MQIKLGKCKCTTKITSRIRNDLFKYINKAGDEFKITMFKSMANFILKELVPDTYNYTKLFGLWKQKGSELDLNMMRMVLKTPRSSRMQPHINKHYPYIQIGGIAGNTCTEHPIVLKHWMKSNKTKGVVGIFQTFYMEKFFNKEGLIDTLYTM